MIEKSHFLPCNLPRSVIPGGGGEKQNKTKKQKKQLKSSVYVFRFLFNFYN